MLQGYVDDSGSDGTRTPFVLAGYILPSEKWAAFSDEWQSELLRQPKIDYFKMREAAHRIDEFEGMSVEFRDCKVKDLLAIIRRHDLDGIYTVLDWKDYRELLEPILPSGMKEGIRTVYSTLFFNILETVVFYQKRKQIGPETVDLDFDEQGEAGEWAQMFYPSVKATAGPDIQAIIGRTPTMLDDKKVVALQAADLLAWSLRREFDSGDPDQKSYHWLYEELNKSVWLGTHLGRKSIEALREIALQYQEEGPQINEYTRKLLETMPVKFRPK